MSWFNVIFLIYQVIAIVTVIHVIMDNRQPAKTMAWALVIWFIPVVGIVFYLFFGINTRKERHVSERSMNQLTKRSMLEFAEQQNLRLPDKHKPLIDLFINQNLSLPFKDNKVAISSFRPCSPPSMRRGTTSISTCISSRRMPWAIWWLTR